MVFASLVFLTIFLPLFLGVYYLVPFRRKSLVILVGSYVFYGWWRMDFLLLFFGVTLVNYLICHKLLKERNATRKKRWLALGVAGNLCTLGYFKYFNFGVAAMNALLGATGESPLIFTHVILPIGISFYIFHSISFLIDVYRGDAKLSGSFVDFAAFIALLPQLIAGPVLRYKDVAPQFLQRTHSWAKFNEGAIRFMLGFAKKVLVADSLAPIVDAVFSQPDPSLADAWLGAIAYTVQLYFDFSAYSHMAIGLGLMMGFRFMENFNHPYISRSITEFWRRWHISLSTWLRDYLYIPLGGNRKGEKRTYFNLLTTMFLGGLWHGANWTFILWGIWHGSILAIERLIGGKKGTPYPKLLALPITLVMVVTGWVMFRAADVTNAMGMYAGMLGMHGTAFSDTIAWQVTPLHWATLIAAGLIIAISPRYIHVKARSAVNAKVNFGAEWAAHMPRGEQLGIIALFALAFCKLIAQSHSPFLYFQF